MEYDDLESFRFYSRGYKRDPVAYFNHRILVGPGEFLTPYFMEKHDITHVINCAFEEHSPTWFKTEYPENYVCLEAEDSNEISLLKWYPKFKEYMQKFLNDSLNSGGTVYVHCQMGINRSGYLSLAYLCKELGHTFFTTAVHGIQQRPCLFQNISYFYEVRDFLTNK